MTAIFILYLLKNMKLLNQSYICLPNTAYLLKKQFKYFYVPSQCGRGPSIEPCGTPVVRLQAEVSESFQLTSYDLLPM